MAVRKKYITLKNGLIAFGVICLILLVFIGVSIREWKQENRSRNAYDKELKAKYEALERKYTTDSLKLDSIEKAFTANQFERAKEIHTIHTIKEYNVKEITKPDISNDELRKLLSK